MKCSARPQTLPDADESATGSTALTTEEPLTRGALDSSAPDEDEVWLRTGERTRLHCSYEYILIIKYGKRVSGLSIEFLHRLVR